MQQQDTVTIYQEDRKKVLEFLQQGIADYFDFSSWPFQDRFFAFLLSIDFFQQCGKTYPSPRKKQEVPLWILLTCEVLLKLNTTSVHSRLPGILKNGPILSRVKFNLERKEGGYNHKNRKPRETVVHHDSVRKFFKNTNRHDLQRWYNQDFIRFIRGKRGFDKKGVFLLDQSHIVVPDNPNYKGVEYLRVDEFGHRIDTTNMDAAAAKAVKPRPCYTVSELLHVSKQDECSIVAGYDWGGGKEDELVQARRIVQRFVDAVGKGVMQLLIVDRGYIDGKFITFLKNEVKSDVMIPMRKNMQILQYSIGIANSKAQSRKWCKYKKYKKNNMQYSEEVMLIPDAYTWDECEVPLHISLMKVTASSQQNVQTTYWALATTVTPRSAKETFDTYKLRTMIEERYRQHKHFWKIHKFSTPSRSLMETHIAFTLLTYTLLQLYLSKRHLSKIANKTIDTLRQQQSQGKDCVVVYKGLNFAVFDLDFYTEIIADLNEEARKRIKAKIAQNRKAHSMKEP